MKKNFTRETRSASPGALTEPKEPTLTNGDQENNGKHRLSGDGCCRRLPPAGQDVIHVPLSAFVVQGLVIPKSRKEDRVSVRLDSTAWFREDRLGLTW